MEVWFYSRIGTPAARPTHALKKKQIYTRAPPEGVRRAFALLTKTYHGSQLTGNLGTCLDFIVSWFFLLNQGFLFRVFVSLK
jgi:hypothetical protein